MKRSRILTVVAATAAVVGTTFIGAGMANAATSVSPYNADGTDASWVNTAAQLGQENQPTAGYPATGWFYGATTPEVSGTAAFGPAGVTLSGGTTQLLTATNQPGTDLEDLVNDADFVSAGQVNFQIPLYTNIGGANQGFTTLRPADFGTQDFASTGRWTTSGIFGSFAAGSTHSIAEYQAEIAADAPASTIIGYGFITPAGSTGTVSAVQFAGESTYFTPTPDGTYVPTTLTKTAVTTTGVHVSGSGFFPGEVVDVGFLIDGAQSGGPLDGVTLTAGDDGTVDAQIVIPASAVTTPGTYNLVLVGERSSIDLAGVVTVTADPAAVVTPIAPVPTPVRAAATFAG